MKIGRALKYYRALHHLTQSDVAALSGINEKYLGRIERNESVPTIDKLEQLCLAFDIRTCDLLMAVPEGTPVIPAVQTRKFSPCHLKLYIIATAADVLFNQIWPTLTPMISGAQNVTVSMILKMAISKNLLFIRVQFHNAQTKRTAPAEQSFFVISAQLIPVWRI